MAKAKTKRLLLRRSAVNVSDNSDSNDLLAVKIINLKREAKARSSVHPAVGSGYS